MEWLDNWNKAIKYIEEHLEDEIDIERAARLAGCSAFHFQRMFSYISDVSLSEYIRRRRMTKAAVDLKSSSEKILDISLKYGYDSPTAFNRAFQGVHGIAPSKARRAGTMIKAYPPISFKIIIKGDSEMNYRIEKKDAFKIVGAKEHYSGGIDESFAKVPDFWNKIKETDLMLKLCGLMNTELKGILGVCTEETCKDFDYYISVATEMDTPAGMDEFIVPASEWAVFECIGPMPSTVQNMQKRIMSEWLPTSGYEYANAPDIELYFDGDQSAEDYKCEVWIPVKRV